MTPSPKINPLLRHCVVLNVDSATDFSVSVLLLNFMVEFFPMPFFSVLILPIFLCTASNPKNVNFGAAQASERLFGDTVF